MNKIYTAGYQGHTVEQLRQAVEAMDGIVCDIRLSPRSRIPGWSEHEMEQALGWRYFHVPEWGNVNFKSGPIKLADPARGWLRVLKFAETTPIILLCGCKEYSTCHRRVCAALLHERGVETNELEWPSTPVAVGKVRCISLWQPWASLIAIGAKQIETRSWSTSYRGPLLIHAAKTTKCMDYCDLEPFGSSLFTGPNAIEDLPLGALVGVCELADCKSTNVRSFINELTFNERAFGDYSANRFGWMLENIRAFPKPIPLRGQQGMWDVEIDLEAALRGEVEIPKQEPPAARKQSAHEPKQANLF